MIDIHNHILFNVDDGVKRLEDSIAILKSYEQMGVKAVMVTPHYAPKRGYYKTPSALNEQFLKLKQAALEANLKVTLFLGSEIDWSEKYLDEVAFAPSLNGTNYVLMDFGAGSPDIEEVVYELGLRNYKVVIAHAERYPSMTLEKWKRVKKVGGIIQVNAKHLMKLGTKSAQKWAKLFLKEEMIDIVASDLHRKENVEHLKKAYKTVAKKTSENYAKQLFANNPLKIIDGTFK